MPALSRSPLFGARGADVAHDPALAVSSRDLIQLAGHAAVLQPLQNLAARARRAGGHLSVLRGRGMDYQESRAYQPGDDIRAMDWRVTARAGTAHTKLFREERERPVVLAVDLGPNMFFATTGALKSVLAAHCAALFGWAAVTQGDRVGALLFDSGHHELRPRPGRQGILRLVRRLVECADPRAGLRQAPAAGALNAALLRLRRLVRPGSLVVLVSDFYGLDDDSVPHLLYLRRHSDLVAVRILDALERRAPPAGRYRVTDGEVARAVDLAARAARSGYAAALQAHHAQAARHLQRSGVAVLELATTDAAATALVAQLAAPAGPRRRARAA